MNNINIASGLYTNNSQPPVYIKSKSPIKGQFLIAQSENVAKWCDYPYGNGLLYSNHKLSIDIGPLFKFNVLNQLDLNTLPVVKGGTGLDKLPNDCVLIGNGTGPIRSFPFIDLCTPESKHNLTNKIINDQSNYVCANEMYIDNKKTIKINQEVPLEKDYVLTITSNNVAEFKPVSSTQFTVTEPLQLDNYCLSIPLLEQYIQDGIVTSESKQTLKHKTMIDHTNLILANGIFNLTKYLPFPKEIPLGIQNSFMVLNNDDLIWTSLKSGNGIHIDSSLNISVDLPMFHDLIHCEFNKYIHTFNDKLNKLKTSSVNTVSEISILEHNINHAVHDLTNKLELTFKNVNDEIEIIQNNINELESIHNNTLTNKLKECHNEINDSITALDHKFQMCLQTYDHKLEHKVTQITQQITQQINEDINNIETIRESNCVLINESIANINNSYQELSHNLNQELNQLNQELNQINDLNQDELNRVNQELNHTIKETNDALNIELTHLNETLTEHINRNYDKVVNSIEDAKQEIYTVIPIIKSSDIEIHKRDNEYTLKLKPVEKEYYQKNQILIGNGQQPIKTIPSPDGDIVGTHEQQVLYSKRIADKSNYVIANGLYRKDHKGKGGGIVEFPFIKRFYMSLNSKVFINEIGKFQDKILFLNNKCTLYEIYYYCVFKDDNSHQVDIHKCPQSLSIGNKVCSKLFITSIKSTLNLSSLMLMKNLIPDQSCIYIKEIVM